ncbi:MAG: hypothetical protein ABSF82_12565 [Candidatus Bathyarchaeia archaeon]
MKESTKSILVVSIFFSIVVVFVDAFLGQIELLFRVALGAAFLLLSTFILSDLAKLISRKSPGKTTLSTRRDDELLNLERVVYGVLSHESRTVQVLEERLRSMAIRFAAIKTNLPEDDLIRMANEQPNTLAQLVRSDVIGMIRGTEPVLRNASTSELDITLTKIERSLV